MLRRCANVPLRKAAPSDSAADSATPIVRCLKLRNFCPKLPSAAAAQALYSWWQYELCDVFIELVKPVMARGDSEEGAEVNKRAFRDTLWICLDTGLR